MPLIAIRMHGGNVAFVCEEDLPLAEVDLLSVRQEARGQQLCVCVCVCACVRVGVCVCAPRVFVCMCVHHVCLFACVCLYVGACVSILVCWCGYVCVLECKSLCVNMCIYVRWSVCICVCWGVFVCVGVVRRGVCLHGRTFTCVYQEYVYMGMFGEHMPQHTDQALRAPRGIHTFWRTHKGTYTNTCAQTHIYIYTQV